MRAPLFRRGLAIAVLLGALPGALPAGAQQCPKPPLPAFAGVWALAVTWQAAFCETFDARRRPLPEECPAASQFDAFTLHGLWPQWQEYCLEGINAADLRRNPSLGNAACSVSRDDMPAVELSPALAGELRTVMPGVRSKLERHEWFKHGTCSALGQEEYFRTAVDLVQDLNRTTLRGFVADHAGTEGVTVRRLCQALEAAFGPAAAKAAEASIRPHTGPDGRRRYYLIEILLWLKPVDGRLGLTPDHFVPVTAGARTLGPQPADPLCDDKPGRVVYIDRPGMGQ